jgi:8-oxo-dGTP diphosphatase
MRAVSLVRGAVDLGVQVMKLLWRRPTIGALAVALDANGRYVLIRRGDTGSWGLPGGLVDYGERVEQALEREVTEETGYRVVEVRRIIGVYSAPDRDPRMHSVCVAVEALVEPAGHTPNPLEVRDVRAFDWDAVPATLAFDARQILDDQRRGGRAVLA